MKTVITDYAHFDTAMKKALEFQEEIHLILLKRKKTEGMLSTNQLHPYVHIIKKLDEWNVTKYNDNDIQNILVQAQEKYDANILLSAATCKAVNHSAAVLRDFFGKVEKTEKKPKEKKKETSVSTPASTFPKGFPTKGSDWTLSEILNRETRKRYPKGFKEALVNLTKSGIPISDISSAYGVSSTLISKWKTLDDASADELTEESVVPGENVCSANNPMDTLSDVAKPESNSETDENASTTSAVSYTIPPIKEQFSFDDPNDTFWRNIDKDYSLFAKHELDPILDRETIPWILENPSITIPQDKIKETSDKEREGTIHYYEEEDLYYQLRSVMEGVKCEASESILLLLEYLAMRYDPNVQPKELDQILRANSVILPPECIQAINEYLTTWAKNVGEIPMFDTETYAAYNV